MKKESVLSQFGKNNWTILLLFGIMGQIAWSVENMYFNLFVFDTISPSLDTVTLMVQLSGIVATVTTLVAGVLSDKVGNRRTFISVGYVIWGITVALFGYLSPELTSTLFGVPLADAVRITLVLVIVGDCIMTLFGSSANDAAFNAWVTDNTESSYRGRVEGVLSILPLAAMLIVAGGFGILVEALGYSVLFTVLGVVITASGVFGIFYIKDSNTLKENGTLKDIFYGFRPSVIKSNAPLYFALLVILVYGIASQIFMPYLIIYMKTYLGFTVVEYSVVFGIAIALGAAANLALATVSDKYDKPKLLYIAAGVFAFGLFAMYLSNLKSHIATLILFGIAGFIMITGYIFTSALAGSLVRDYTPKNEVGKLQGVRMVFSVLIPMLVGPMIGNAINRSMNIPLPDMDSADTMTTEFIPAPEIFLAAAIATLVIFAVIPVLVRSVKKRTAEE